MLRVLSGAVVDMVKSRKYLPSRNLKEYRMLVCCLRVRELVSLTVLTPLAGGCARKAPLISGFTHPQYQRLQAVQPVTATC